MAYNQNPYYGGYYQPNYYPNNGAMPDMLNQQKMAYQQPMQTPQQMVGTQMSSPTPTSDFIWVQGESGAKSYLVAPNSTVTLWDSENPTIYIKSANAQGVPTLRTLDFTERTPENAQKQPTSHECQCGNKYVSKEDFEALKDEFEALKGKVKKSAKKIVEPITSEDYD